MKAYPEGFPFNSATQKLQRHAFDQRVKPMTLDKFRAEHSAHAREWTIILDESPALHKPSEGRLPSSALVPGRDPGKINSSAIPFLFVRNILRAAGFVPLLTGTNASLANVAESATGSGVDGRASSIKYPFAHIVRQGIGRPPDVVDGWIKTLKKTPTLKAGLSVGRGLDSDAQAHARAREWERLVDFLRQAFTTGNPRVSIRTLDFLRPPASSSIVRSKLSTP